MEYAYRFPVVRGVQASHEYYIAMVPLKMLSRLFAAEDEYVPPEYRAQRKVNTARIPQIKKYILDNRDSYVFSAISASIDGEFRFFPAEKSENNGMLEISMDAKFLLNDGQHRKAAILEALQEDPTLGNETISIVLFSDEGLTRSQQIFTDLNKNAVKTSNSISELYDSRDAIAVMTRNVIQKIEFLNTYTDKEKDNLGKYSSNLFTLNTFYSANKMIVGRDVNSGAEEFLYQFWNTVTLNMVLWQELAKKEITKIDLRENYIVTQNVVIHALGRIGNYFLLHEEVDMKNCLKGLQKINWNRKAKQWYLRAIGQKGRIISNKNAVLLISNTIKMQLGMELSALEKAAERTHKQAVRE